METVIASPEIETIDSRIAGRLKALRDESGWTLDELAQKCGVSRASLSRLENAEVSPTAVVLSRLCATYGIAVSRLMHMAEGEFAPLLARDAQPMWADPETAFERRSISPPVATLAGEVLECRLGPASRIDYDVPPRLGLEHHLLLVFGRLEVTVDGTTYDLKSGDCLRYCLTGPSAFETPAGSAARYYLFMV